MMMVSTMVDNSFDLQRFSHHLRRVRVVNRSSDSDKIPRLQRERSHSPHATPRKAKPAALSKISKPLKIVHFARDATYYECPATVSDEDCDTFWHNEQDYAAFKRNTLKAARDIRRNNAHLTAGIDNALEQSKQYAGELKDQAELETLLQHLPAPSKELQEWCKDQSLRGLERLSSRTLNEHVYSNQMLRSKLKVFRKSVNEEGIRMMQEQDSRCSCILARWIGLCDALAATSADDA